MSVNAYHDASFAAEDLLTVGCQRIKRGLGSSWINLNRVCGMAAIWRLSCIIAKELNGVEI